MPVLRNVKVAWASVQKPNVMFEPTWEIQVTLSPEQAKDLQAEAKALNPKGIKIKNEDNGTKTFRFKRRVERADGQGENKPPVVCGTGGKNDVFDKLIGNGSICNVQYALVKYDNPKFGKGITTDLKGVQVMIHVPFGVQDGDEFGSADTPSESTKKDDSYDDGDF
jgi:hypothetical protein